MNLGEFFLAIFEYLYGFWPLRIVHAWEGGLRMFNGKVKAELPGGLHWFVPLFGEILSENIVTDVNKTETQTVETQDGLSVSFSLAIKYRLSSVAKMYINIQDHDDTVANEVCASACAQVALLDADDIQQQLPEAIFLDVHGQLDSWGVELEAVFLNDFTPSRTMRLLMGD